jgi:hypothetical protein
MTLSALGSWIADSNGARLNQVGTTARSIVLEIIPIIAHESGGGYVWWDEALYLILPVVIAVAVVLWLRRRSASDRDDDQRV